MIEIDLCDMRPPRTRRQRESPVFKQRARGQEHRTSEADRADDAEPVASSVRGESSTDEQPQAKAALAQSRWLSSASRPVPSGRPSLM